MDVYTDPALGTYEKYTRFYMPTEDGGSILSMAVSRRSGNLFVAGYSVLLFLLFSAFWQLILYLVIAYFPSKDNPNRHVLMVGFWNSGDPLTAFMFTLNYTRKAFSYMRIETETKTGNENGSGTKTVGRDWATLRVELSPPVAAMCGTIGGIAAGILVPTAMVVGSVAPAQASQVFFGHPPTELTPSEGLRAQALRAPAAVRAIGSVEASEVTLRDWVSIIKIDIPGDKPTTRYSYNYTVSGWDPGLQKYAGFRQIVSGECTTDYTWLASGTADDVYRPWGFQNDSVVVKRTAEERDPPFAELRMHPNYESDAANGGKILFAIIPHTIGRHSFTASSDPWYRTVSATNASANDAGYRVESGPPALSCWQQTSYTYMGYKANCAFQLKNLKGFNIPQAWDNHFRTEFGVPKLVDLGVSLGRGILLSSATYLKGSFDAKSSTVQDDIERLVLGTFVASRDIFRDSTTVTQKDRISNAATQGNGHPQPGVGDFVLATGKVVTLKFDILIAIPALTASLYVVVTAILYILKSQQASNKGVSSRFTARHSAFQAVQLYHYMDEHIAAGKGIPGTENSGEYYSGLNKRWEGRAARVPYIDTLGAGGAIIVGGFKVSNCLKPKVVPATEQDIKCMASGNSNTELALARVWSPEISSRIHWKNMKKLAAKGDIQNAGAGTDHTNDAGEGTNCTPSPPPSDAQNASAGTDHTNNASEGTNRTPSPPPSDSYLEKVNWVEDDMRRGNLLPFILFRV